MRIVDSLITLETKHNAVMMAGFLVTFRESVEVILILSIVAVYLKRLGKQEFYRYLWIGAAIGVVASAALGVGLPLAYKSPQLSEAAANEVAIYAFFAALLLLAYMMKRYFYIGMDAIMMIAVVFTLMFAGLSAYGATGALELLQAGALFSATVVLTYVTYWMARVAYKLRERVVERINVAVTRGKLLGIMGLAAMAVLREGAEVSLILLGIVLVSPVDTGIGALLGVSAAVLLGAIYVRKMVSVDWRRFFLYTSLLLVIFSSGILKLGVQDLVSVSIIPPITERVYDASNFLPDKGILGGLLYVFIGYTQVSPLLPLIVQTAYLAIALLLVAKVYGVRLSPSAR